MAWNANSGQNWDEKYAAWVESMEQISSHSYGETFRLETPYGKELPAPALECAESALFLRAAFASWYGLPFYLEAADAQGRIFIGHFGFLRANGQRYAGSPNFHTSYQDHSDQAERWEAEGWPSDANLRGRRLGGNQDDFQPFLGEEAHAGAYFDEAFLNKRVGYFMIYLLSYFGSIHLADPNNLFNLKPQALRAGDPLVKRYRRTGIGHVYVTKQVERFAGGMEAQLVSGSMPRRQPKWEGASTSESAYTSHYGGGEGENSDGDTYAALGGGLKRWRWAEVQNGRWRNIVPEAYRVDYIDSEELAAIAERPNTFAEILRQRSPEERREALLEQIEASREHLRHAPASCSARERREEAFEKLYELEQAEFGASTQETDEAHRSLEDYVFPEMIYDLSKTCCWNSSTAAMYELIMSRAREMVEDHDESQCHMPPAFKAEGGGYEAWRAYAEGLGRGEEWLAWSEDEACPPRDVVDDSEAEHSWSDWCQVGVSILAGGAVWPGQEEPEDPEDPEDPPIPNNSPWACSAPTFGR